MADDIRQKFTTEADVKGLNNLSSSMDKAAKETKELAVEIAKLNKAAKGDPTQALNRGLQTTANAAKKADSSLSKAAGAANRMKKGANSSAAAIGSLATQLTRLTRITFIQFFLRGFFQLQQAIRDSVNAAGEFERSLAEIRTISGDAKRSIEDMSQVLTQMSNALGVDRLELAAASYQALSAQVVDTANVFPFIQTAAQLALATLSDTKEAVDALATVMNSFGATAGSVEDIAGKLFKTVELGRIRMGELSKVIGRVAPLAAELGVSLDETLAGLASLTTGGLNAAEAGTLLSNVMLKMIKPTKGLSDVFAALGVTSGEVLIAQEGFRGALDKIAETGGSTSAEMGKLFGRIRALRAALALTGKQAKEFDKDLQEIKDAGAKDLQAAFEEIKTTNFQQLQRNLQTLKNTLVDTFGTAITSAINNFFSLIGGAEEIFLNLTTVAVLSAGAILAAWVVSMGGIGGAIIGLQVLALEAQATIASGWLAALGPAGWAILGITAGVALVIRAYQKAQVEVGKLIEAHRKASEENRKQAEKDAKSTVKFRQEIFEKDLSTILKLFDASTKPIAAAIEGAKTLVKIFRDDLGQQIDDKIKGIQSVVERVRDVIREARQGLADMPRFQREVARELRDFRVDKTIDRIEDKVQASNRALREAGTRRGEAFRFSAKGLKEEANAAFEAARAYAQRGESLAAGAKGGKGAETRAIQLQDQLIRDQITLRKTLLDAQTKNGQAVAKIVGEVNLLSGAAEAAAKKQKKLQEELAKGVTATRKEEIQKEYQEQADIIEKAIAAAGPRIQAIAKAGFPDIAKGLDITTRIFDPITNSLVKIGDATRSEIEATNNFIKTQIETLHPVLQDLLKRMNLTLTIGGIPLAKQQLVDLGKEAKNVADVAATILQAQKEIRKETGENEKIIADIQRLSGKKAVVTGGGAIPLRIKIIEQASEALKTSLGEAETAYERFNEALAAKDLDLAKERFSEFTKAVDDVSKHKGSENFVKLLQQLGTGVESQLRNLRIVVNEEGKEAIDRLNEIQSAVGDAARRAPEVKEEVKKVGTEGGAVMGAGVAQGAQIGMDALDALGQKAIDTAALVAQAGAGGASKWYGGQPLYRAAGGLTRGMDRQLVAMSPDEFMVTGRAAKQFFPQFSAANAGVSPVFKEQGGSVHNEIGNISVNVTESAAPRTTARQVVAEIKREVRRGTTFFKGN